MRPDVRALVIDEYRNVTNHANGLLRAVLPQCAPLLPEEKLHHPPDSKLCAQIAFDGIKCSCVSTREFAGPLAPISPTFLTNRVKQNVVIEPPRVFFAESIEPLAVPARSVRQKILRGLPKQWQLLAVYLLIVNATDFGGQSGESARISPSVLRQTL